MSNLSGPPSEASLFILDENVSACWKVSTKGMHNVRTFKGNSQNNPIHGNCNWI